MIHSVDSILSYEVKKEVADRYFGFRKLIEEDIKAYDQRVLGQLFQLEQEIGFDLIRLYILLKEMALIHAFFELTDLRDDLFLDAYLLESPTVRQRLFQGQRTHGWSAKARFTNLFLGIYDRLSSRKEEHQHLVAELRGEQMMIAEEIKRFYRNHDLTTILSFLRGLSTPDGKAEGPLSHDASLTDARNLEERMRVKAPPPAETMLPYLSRLKPRRLINSQLKRLAHRAYALQPGQNW